MTLNITAAAETVYEQYLRDQGEIDHVRADKSALATALRSAAYLVIPAKPSLDSCCDRREQRIRHQFLSIADQIEGIN